MAFDFDTAPDRSGTGSIKWAHGELIALGLADMDFPTAPSVRKALEDRIAHGVFGYTRVGQGLLDAVASWLAARRQWPVEPDWITVCPGIVPSIAHLLRGLVEPGSGVIVQTPGFAPIRTVIEQNGFRPVDNPLVLVDGRYRMDLAGFRAAAVREDVTAFVLCSPHNPMGRVWSKAELAEVARICESSNLLVISDEIHAEMIFPGTEFTPYAGIAAPGARHVTLFGPSKGFNLPGLRTAVAVIPDHGLRSRFLLELHRVNEDFGVNVMGAIALEAAYSRGGEWLDALTTYVHGNVQALIEGFRTRLPAVRAVVPEASFLVWVDLRLLELDDREVIQRIEGAGVAVEPGTSFGTGGSGFIRLNVGTPRRRLMEGVARIGRALQGG